MPRTPTLSDDGRTVTLDLHGARVAEAEDLLWGAAEVASGAGRHTLRVVHGASTTDWDGGNRTVKTAVRALLDSGALDAWVASEHRTEGAVLLGLHASDAADRRRITLADL